MISGIINRGDSFRRRSRSNSLLPKPDTGPPDKGAPSPPPDVVSYTVGLLGAQGVGKTSLISQFMTSECINAYDRQRGNWPRFKPNPLAPPLLAQPALTTTPLRRSFRRTLAATFPRWISDSRIAESYFSTLTGSWEVREFFFALKSQRIWLNSEIFLQSQNKAVLFFNIIYLLLSFEFLREQFLPEIMPEEKNYWKVAVFYSFKIPRKLQKFEILVNFSPPCWIRDASCGGNGGGGRLIAI